MGGEFWCGPNLCGEDPEEVINEYEEAVTRGQNVCLDEPWVEAVDRHAWQEGRDHKGQTTRTLIRKQSMNEQWSNN